MKATVVSKEIWDDRSMGGLKLRVETDRFDMTFDMFLSEDGGCEWVETSIDGRRVLGSGLELLEEWISDAALDGNIEEALEQENSVMEKRILNFLTKEEFEGMAFDQFVDHAITSGRINFV